MSLSFRHLHPLNFRARHRHSSRRCLSLIQNQQTGPRLTTATHVPMPDTILLWADAQAWTRTVLLEAIQCHRPLPRPGHMTDLQCRRRSLAGRCNWRMMILVSTLALPHAADEIDANVRAALSTPAPPSATGYSQPQQYQHGGLPAPPDYSGYR
jgi:hypothetical protein